jgi:2,4-dienoyl-CoA reductase-like NADH-dependent reductase (Old Yellow Enzyme family)/thioredoxin reductase
LRNLGSFKYSFMPLDVEGGKMEKKFTKLLEPIRLGPHVLKNRMIMSPMWNRYASVNGEVTQQTIDYYVERAKSGVAMIIQEATGVDPNHLWIEPQLRIDDDKFVPGLHKLVEAIHNHGALVICQLHHAGMFGRNPVAPSDVPSWGAGGLSQPKTMTLAEIEEARELFIAAGYRAMEAGYDGVELHGSTSYLLQQFSSPHSNKRTDKYGGGVERRATLAREITRGIRSRCGPDFPLGYTTVPYEEVPDGMRVEEAIDFTRFLLREGIDYVHFLPGTYETFHYEGGRGTCQRQRSGVFDITKAFKDALKMNVFARTCGQNDPLVWEESLKKGEADAILIGRAMLSDPHLPRKVIEGRLDDIRPCIKCNYCYESGVIKKYQLGCSLNPELGREREYAITSKVSHPKKALVVGGGPGGLEAARVAALRGHDVTLMEKESELGGTMIVASLPIGKEILMSFVKWAADQCRKIGVNILLNTEVTPEVVKEAKPDVVIVATGATPLKPEIPGVDKPHVVIAEEVLRGKAGVGKRVVVLGGLGQTGAETADFIVEKGLAETVTIVMRSGGRRLAEGMDPVNRAHLMQVIWPRLGIKVMRNMDIEEITDNGLVGIDRNWQRHSIEADTVVLARGYVPSRTLYEALRGQVPEVYAIGDCVKARNIREAVHEGAYIARQIRLD